MNISCDRKTKKLWLSQESYIEKMHERFMMLKWFITSKAKLVSSPFGGHFKLYSKQSPSAIKRWKK